MAGKGSGKRSDKGSGRSHRKDSQPRRGTSSRHPRGQGRRPEGPRPHRPTPPHPDQLEGRNVVLCALRASKRVRVVWVDEAAKPCPKLAEARRIAEDRQLPWERIPRAELDTVAENRIHNGIIGFAEPLPSWSLEEILEQSDSAGRDPFVVLLNQVQYEQNLGAILRTAACAGVDALVLPTRRGARLSPTVQRIAMGGAEEVPVVHEGMMSALANLRRRGVRIYGAEAAGENLYTGADFSGPLALVLGGEDRGLSEAIRSRCDRILALPLAEGSDVGSLNVSVAAGLMIFERVRALNSGS